MGEANAGRRTRRTAVEAHPKRKQIELDMAEGMPIRSMSTKYHISRTALAKYRDERLSTQIIKSVEKRDITNAEELFNVILKTVRRMELISDACDKFLDDPNTPGEYYVGPRAHEVAVVYMEAVHAKNRQGEPYIKWTKRKANLQDLINSIEEDGEKKVVSLQTNDADPRVLLVKSSEALAHQMDTLVQAWRSVDQGKSSFLGTPAWEQVVKVIQSATNNYPEVRRLIADGLSGINS